MDSIANNLYVGPFYYVLFVKSKNRFWFKNICYNE